MAIVGTHGAKSNTKWTAANEVTLVSVHLKEKQKANWGDNNPTLLWNWP